MVTKAVKQLARSGGDHRLGTRELNALHRLPKISAATARKLLGPLADRIPTPVALRTFASPCPDGTHAASKKELKAAKQAAKEAATSTTSTTTSTTTTTPATTPLAPDATTAPEATPTTLPSGTVHEGCAAD